MINMSASMPIARFPFIYFNLSGFSILLVNKSFQEAIYVVSFPQKRCVVILTSNYLLKSNRSHLLMIQSLAKGKLFHPVTRVILLGAYWKYMLVPSNFGPIMTIRLFLSLI